MLSSESVPVANSHETPNPADHLVEHRWEKGKSGNPSGRPKSWKIRSLLEGHTGRVAARLIELLESKDERVAIVAAKEILDRVYGKTAPQEDAEDGDRKQITINIVRYGSAATENEPGLSASPAVQIRSFGG